MSQSKESTFVVRFSRRLPDPVFPTAERHVFLCAAAEIPVDLPKDPNPRNQRIDRPIWREIKKHLLNEEGTPNTFHLKNKGITVIAQKVERVDDEHYKVSLSPGHGIVDGAHTYELLIQSRDEILEKNNNGEDQISQFVKFEVLTGVEKDLATEIAGGLNTAVQVQTMSLANLEHHFDWMKAELKSEPYAEAIAFRENEDAIYDARDVVVMLDLFNIYAFPNDGQEHPIRAYSKKATVLDYYLDNKGEYERLRPILKDILALHDTISLEARDLHNKTGGKGGRLAFVESRVRGAYRFHFINREGPFRLAVGALFPMLGAFRWMVQEDPSTGMATWRGKYRDVLNLWRKVGGEMMRATQATSDELARNLNAIGKSRNHWANLHSTVAKHDLMLKRN